MPQKPLVRRAVRQALTISRALREKYKIGPSKQHRDMTTACFVRVADSHHPGVKAIARLGGAATLASVVRRRDEVDAGGTDDALRCAVWLAATEGLLVCEVYAEPWMAREAVRRGNPFACLHPLVECPHCGSAFAPTARATEWWPRTALTMLSTPP